MRRRDGSDGDANSACARTNRARIRKMKQIITEDPAVERVGELLTMHMGPQHALLTVEKPKASGRTSLAE
jgi:hypothetical protein